MFYSDFAGFPGAWPSFSVSRLSMVDMELLTSVFRYWERCLWTLIFQLHVLIHNIHIYIYTYIHIPRSTWRMKKVPQSIVAFICVFLCRNALKTNAAKKKRDSSKKMPQIRTTVVGNILVECRATTHSATFSPPSLWSMSCDTAGLCLVSCKVQRCKYNKFGQLARRTLRGHMHPCNWQTTYKNHPGRNTMESLNHVATTFRSLRQITPQLTPPLLCQNTPQLRNKSLLDWPDRGRFEKSVAVQTCTLIREQQELRLSVGLVRNTIPAFFSLHWDKWVKVSAQHVVQPWKMLKPCAPASCTVFASKQQKIAAAEMQKCHNFKITPQHRWSI